MSSLVSTKAVLHKEEETDVCRQLQKWNMLRERRIKLQFAEMKSEWTERWQLQCKQLAVTNSDSINVDALFFSIFPCVGVRLVYWSLRYTATFVIRFHWSLLLASSLHFSSSSAFLRSLFTQSSHLNCVSSSFSATFLLLCLGSFP